MYDMKLITPLAAATASGHQQPAVIRDADRHALVIKQFRQSAFGGDVGGWLVSVLAETLIALARCLVRLAAISRCHSTFPVCSFCRE